MTDERSERLRRRRKRSSEAAVDEEEAGAPATRSSGAGTDEGDAADTAIRTDTAADSDADADDDTGEDASLSIKEEQTGTYMYLPESQTKELRRLYNVLKAKYEFAYDSEFEKNRHFYPLVVQHGLESLDGSDAEEIRRLLEELR